jgi:hypothetical protein
MHIYEGLGSQLEVGRAKIEGVTLKMVGVVYGGKLYRVVAVE